MRPGRGESGGDTFLCMCLHPEMTTPPCKYCCACQKLTLLGSAMTLNVSLPRVIINFSTRRTSAVPTPLRRSFDATKRPQIVTGHAEGSGSRGSVVNAQYPRPCITSTCVGEGYSRFKLQPILTMSCTTSQKALPSTMPLVRIDASTKSQSVFFAKRIAGVRVVGDASIV